MIGATDTRGRVLQLVTPRRLSRRPGDARLPYHARRQRLRYVEFERTCDMFKYWTTTPRSSSPFAAAPPLWKFP
eukprot:1802715-Heterocapsa_arctica.AAC.1